MMDQTHIVRIAKYQCHCYMDTKCQVPSTRVIVASSSVIVKQYKDIKCQVPSTTISTRVIAASTRFIVQIPIAMYRRCHCSKDALRSGEVERSISQVGSTRTRTGTYVGQVGPTRISCRSESEPSIYQDCNGS